MLRNLLREDWLKALTLAALIIGVLLVVTGAAFFVDASIKLPKNLAYQARSSGTEIPLQSEAEGRMLMAADIEARSLESQRDQALIIGGAGLVVVALGWIGYNFVNSRRSVA
jgi:hypothetical protein